jgi:hypothetical protein
MKKWYKIIAYILGIGTLGSTPALVLEYGDLLWGETEKVESSPRLALEEVKEENPKERIEILDSIDAEAWDEVLRTSDYEQEKSTQIRQRYQAKRPKDYRAQPAPDGGHRIGCECMDQVLQEKRGRGACAGHGGVRYWIYLMPDESKRKLATWRHEQHPDPLNAAELASLDGHRPAKRPTSYQPPDSSEMELMLRGTPIEQEKEDSYDQEEQRTYGKNWGFYDVIVILMICITIAFITHSMFSRK